MNTPATAVGLAPNIYEALSASRALRLTHLPGLENELHAQ